MRGEKGHAYETRYQTMGKGCARVPPLRVHDDGGCAGTGIRRAGWAFSQPSDGAPNASVPHNAGTIMDEIIDRFVTAIFFMSHITHVLPEELL